MHPGDFWVLLLFTEIVEDVNFLTWKLTFQSRLPIKQLIHCFIGYLVSLHYKNIVVTFVDFEPLCFMSTLKAWKKLNWTSTNSELLVKRLLNYSSFTQPVTLVLQPFYNHLSLGLYKGKSRKKTEKYFMLRSLHSSSLREVHTRSRRSIWWKQFSILFY